MPCKWKVNKILFQHFLIFFPIFLKNIYYLLKLGSILESSDFGSEVGFSTGNGVEGDLFVLLKKDVISTQRPVRDGVITIMVKLQGGRGCVCVWIPLFAHHICESNSEDTELLFGVKCIPSGEFERHFFHWLDVLVKLGQQPGVYVPPEL